MANRVNSDNMRYYYRLKDIVVYNMVTCLHHYSSILLASVIGLSSDLDDYLLVMTFLTIIGIPRYPSIRHILLIRVLSPRSLVVPFPIRVDL